uniref:Uncharacterized protein n=1 Tax=Kalanchoe fedtschenkoi TaxID=63787 RepID=A0A7N0UKJ3_KALFE
MPRSRIAGVLSSPKVDVAIDMGNPFLNLTVDGFLKIGTVAATRSAAEDAYHVVKRGDSILSIYCLSKCQELDMKCLSFGHMQGASGAMILSIRENVVELTRCCFYLQLKKMCKEGAYWGSIAGLYVGMEYGAERIRGSRDWKNAMIGGALTGAVVSAVSNKSKDKIVVDAITGGAIATAAEFINYLT